MVPLRAAGNFDAVSTFKFTDGDFRNISRILRAEAGIYLSDAKAPFVYSRLTKRLRTLGMQSFQEYCSLIESEAGSGERQQMIAALTTNVTRFFREPHHFEHFRKNVVERMADAVKGGRRMRVWSSACSNGQEPYSIAMTILATIPNADTLDVRVLATDIDANMIAAARAGEYGSETMTAVPDDMKRKWFVSTPDRDGSWGISDKLASLVVYRELNLVGPWPMKARFDAIFCRNVAIYFDDKTQQELWRRFVPMLNPLGYLYIGHSERVAGPAANDLISDGVTVYRVEKGATF